MTTDDSLRTIRQKPGPCLSTVCSSRIFTYTVYLSVCMSPVYVYGPCYLILNKMMMMMMITQKGEK